MSRIWPNGGTSSPPTPGNARPDQAFRSTAEYGIPHDLTEWHRGIDLVGFDWIRAADDGKVVFSGHNGTAGYEIKIRHTDLTSTRYLHMEFGSLKFITGQYVKKGEIIGKMGASGYVTGKHLHFECIDANGATRINPRKYINPEVVLGNGSTPFDPNGEDKLNEKQDFMLNHLFEALCAGIPNVQKMGPGYAAMIEARDNAVASYAAIRETRSIAERARVAAQTASDSVTPGIEGVKWDGQLYALVKNKNFAVDVAALARDLAPAITAALPRLSSEDVSKVSQAVADDLSRRLAE